MIKKMIKKLKKVSNLAILSGWLVLGMLIAFWGMDSVIAASCLLPATLFMVAYLKGDNKEEKSKFNESWKSVKEHTNKFNRMLIEIGAFLNKYEYLSLSIKWFANTIIWYL